MSNFLRQVHLTLDLMAHWWHRLISSRYVLMLEARVRQLEADNLALRDTIFGIRGLPPIPRGETQRFTAVPASQPAAANETPAGIRPVVEAIRRTRDRREDAQKAREREAELVKQGAEQVRDAKAAYDKEIQLERDREAGKGVVVTRPGAEPVVVQEEMVDANS